MPYLYCVMPSHNNMAGVSLKADQKPLNFSALWCCCCGCSCCRSCWGVAIKGLSRTQHLPSPSDSLLKKDLLQHYLVMLLLVLQCLLVMRAAVDILRSSGHSWRQPRRLWRWTDSCLRFFLSFLFIRLGMARPLLGSGHWVIRSLLRPLRDDFVAFHVTYQRRLDGSEPLWKMKAAPFQRSAIWDPSRAADKWCSAVSDWHEELGMGRQLNGYGIP